MALKFKELNDELKKAPLTKEELNEIDSVEKYVDTEIKNRFKGGVVRILLSKVDFLHNTKDGFRDYNKPDVRATLQFKELKKRYTDAGWNTEIQIDDMLDGPNMSGPDYWVLTGK